MSGYSTKQESIAMAGVDDLIIRSLLDRQQYADPSGDALRQGISSSNWPLFGLLWPSAAHLAVRLALRPVVATERILEIGCGLALASLVGHRRGADVTASDCHPLAEAFLMENLRLNGLAPMKYRHGRWGAAGDARSGSVQGPFDLLIGSDLLYERDTGATLAGFIDLHAAPGAEVWIIDPDRGNRPAFRRSMAARGFSGHEERLTALPAVAGQAAPAYKGRLLVYRRGPAAVNAAHG
jgi:predicted nicotinamide N-methyase